MNVRGDVISESKNVTDTLREKGGNMYIQFLLLLLDIIMRYKYVVNHLSKISATAKLLKRMICKPIFCIHKSLLSRVNNILRQFSDRGRFIF